MEKASTILRHRQLRLSMVAFTAILLAVGLMALPQLSQSAFAQSVTVDCPDTGTPGGDAAGIDFQCDVTVVGSGQTEGPWRLEVSARDGILVVDDILDEDVRWTLRSPWQLITTEALFSDEITWDLDLQPNAHYTSGGWPDFCAVLSGDDDNNPIGADDCDQFRYAAEADLSIELGNLFQSAAPGATILYNVEVCNAGPSDVKGIGVDFTAGDNLDPATVVPSASLANNNLYIGAGSCVEGLVSVQVDETAEVGDNVSASAIVDVGDVDWGTAISGEVNAPSDASDVAPFVSEPLPFTDVAVTDIRLNKSIIVPGEELTIEVDVANLSDVPAQNPIVVLELDNLDAILVAFNDGVWRSSHGFTFVSEGTSPGQGALPPNTTEILTVRVQVDSDAHYEMNEPPRRIRAFVTAVNQDSNPGNNTLNLRSILADDPPDFGVQAKAQLSIEKTLFTNRVAPGGSALFEVTVCNDGPSDIFPVRIDDQPGTNLSDVVVSADADANNVASNGLYVAAGQCADALVSAKVDNDALVDDSFENFAYLDFNVGEAAGPGSTEEADIQIRGIHPAQASGTVGDFLPTVDLVVTKDRLPPLGPVASGDTIQWRLTVFNDDLFGDAIGIAENVILRDRGDQLLEPAKLENYNIAVFPQPSVDYHGQPRTCVAGVDGVQCQLGAMAPGEEVTVIVSADARTAAEACGRGNNSAIVSADNPEFFPWDNADIWNPFRVDCSVNLSVEKSVLKDAICLESYGLYEVTVTNDGPTDASKVRINDALPEGLIYGGGSPNCYYTGSTPSGRDRLRCDLESGLKVGESESFLIGFNMDLDVISDGMSVGPNIATGSARIDGVPSNFGPFDSDPRENPSTFTATFCALPPADMAANTTIEPQNIPTAGEVYVFQLWVENLGPNPAEGVIAHHLFGGLPGDWQLVANPTQGADWQCDGHGMTCSRINPMPIGRELVATYQVLLPPDAGTEGWSGFLGDKVLAQELSVTADNPDADLTNNVHRIRELIHTFSELEIEKVALESEIVAGGSSVGFKIFVTNNGPSDAYDVVVADNPGDLTLQSMSSSNLPMNCIFGACTINVLPAGEQAIIDVVITAEPDLAPGDYVNSATLMECRNDGNNTCVLPEPDNAEAPITVLGWADLKLQKFVKPDGAIAAGEPFLFTIFVDNLGVSTAQDVVVEDTIFGSGEFTLLRLAADKGGTCDITPPVDGDVGRPIRFRCDLPELARYERWTIDAQVVADDEIDVNNEARVYAADPQDPDMSNNSDTASMNVGGSADLSVEKTAVTSPIKPGDIAEWTVTVGNDGPSEAVNVQVTDVLPAGILEDTVTVDGAFCTVGTPGNAADPTLCNLGVLASQATVELTVRGQVDPNYVGAPGILNDVSVASETHDPNNGNNRATAAITIISTGELAIFKQSVPSTVVAGEIVDYVIDVTIGAPPTAINVVVSDTLPAGVQHIASEVVGGSGDECDYSAGAMLVTCILGDMTPGTHKQILIHGLVDPGAPAGVVTNAAIVTADNARPKEWSAKTVITNWADLTATKRSSSLSPMTGEVFYYEVEVTNHGPSVSRDVVILDELTGSVDFLYTRNLMCENDDNDVRCEIGAIAVGQTVKFDIVVQVEDDVKDGHRSDNLVMVWSATPPHNERPVHAYSEYIVFRNVNDLKVRKFGKPDGKAEAGEELTYTILVDNFGPGVAYNVRVTDLMASDGSFTFEAPECSPETGRGSLGAEIVCKRKQLKPGDQWRINLTVEADEPQTINNTADVEADGTDLDTSNNHAIVEHAIDAVANLEVTKEVDLETVTAGGELKYKIKVKNLGPSTAYDVQVIDTLPAGVTVTDITKPDNCTPSPAMCVVSHLNNGDSFTFEITVDVDADLPEDTRLVNVVRVSSDAFDDQASNNITSVTSKIAVDEKLRVVKAASATAVYAGGMLDYRIEVTNMGISTVADVIVKDNLPEEVQFVSYQVSNNDGICTESFFDPEVVCDLGDIAPEQTKTIYIRVQVDPATTVDSIRNEVVDDDRFEGSTLSVDTAVLRDRDYRVEYRASVASAKPGDFFYFDVIVINEGTSTIRKVEVDVSLPDIVEYVDDSAGCGSELEDCKLEDIGPGEERSFQVWVQLDSDVGDVDRVTSVVSVSADTSAGTVTVERTSVLFVTDNPGAIRNPLFLPVIVR